MDADAFLQPINKVEINNEQYGNNGCLGEAR
jgi:hypothetical protein